MTSRERPNSRDRLRAERLLAELLREVRDARVARNLSQRRLGNAVGLSDSRVSILERGGHPDVPFVVVAQLLGAVGLELSARAYPSGGGIRDVSQLALLGAFRIAMAPSFTWRSEVPMPIAGDLRAWDAALIGNGLRIGIDAETRLRDIQAVDRRVMLKLRDSGFDRAIILGGGNALQSACPARCPPEHLGELPGAIVDRPAVPGRRTRSRRQQRHSPVEPSRRDGIPVRRR